MSYAKLAKDFYLPLHAMKKVLSPKQLIVIMLAVSVVGAIISRHNYRAGLIVTLVVIGLYILLCLPAFVRSVRRFKSIAQPSKLHCVTWLIFMYIFVRGIVAGTIPYFLLLLTFGLEFLLYDNEKKR